MCELFEKIYDNFIKIKMFKCFLKSNIQQEIEFVRLK